MGEVDVHGEEQQVILKQVQTARPTTQSYKCNGRHLSDAMLIPSNCSMAPGLPHDVLVDECGHGQHLEDG